MSHTPGPWQWYGNARNREVYLATSHSGRRYVMGFRRWGMSGAQPMFQPAERGLVPADTLLTFEVGDRGVRGHEQAKADDSVYRYDIRGIDCDDARLIAAAPELLEALEKIERICGGASNFTGESVIAGIARAAIAKATGAAA
ncbi:hypothetical protein [Sphingomonas sp. Leaf10]|uniref:hypothetical protein n=1 Tax=Sphingomonas sp. Leaf10 TaxID=1735676 RepID=UPI0006F905DF|nr:hypothetical protein [Sphingomonas sp. Leaf10]KQM37973.1 hypothetical protein ASE59_11790 [Sphingomonas sp. Leaf10]